LAFSQVFHFAFLAYFAVIFFGWIRLDSVGLPRTRWARSSCNPHLVESVALRQILPAEQALCGMTKTRTVRTNLARVGRCQSGSDRPRKSRLPTAASCPHGGRPQGLRHSFIRHFLPYPI